MVFGVDAAVFLVDLLDRRPGLGVDQGVGDLVDLAIEGALADIDGVAQHLGEAASVFVETCGLDDLHQACAGGPQLEGFLGLRGGDGIRYPLGSLTRSAVAVRANGDGFPAVAGGRVPGLTFVLDDIVVHAALDVGG